MNNTNDMDIDNYTNEELLDIVKLNDNSTLYDIEQTFDKYIEHYILQNNNKYVDFLNDAKDKLLNIDSEEEEEIIEGFDNQEQDDITNLEEQDDITNLPQAQVNDVNASFLIQQKKLDRSNTNIKQDNLNPILRQTTTKYITINSQYRLNSYPYNYNPYSSKGVDTNFTCTLTETLTNVLSIQLQSVYIPEAWYTFDQYIGNTIFWIYYADSSTNFINNTNIKCYQIEITEGTYKLASDLAIEINSSIQHSTAQYQYNLDGSIILDASGFPVVTYDLSGLYCCIKDADSTNNRLGFLNYTPYFVQINYWPQPALPPGQSDFSGNPQHNESPCTVVTSYEQNVGYYLGARILDTLGNSQLTLIQNLAPLRLILSDTSANVSAQWATALISEYFIALQAKLPLDNINLKTINALILAGTSTALGTSDWPGAYILTTSGLIINNFYTAAPLLGGPQYFQIILDEFHQNYQTTCSIGIAQEDNKLDLPVFYTGISQSIGISNENIYCSDVATNTAIYLPSWPRQATQAQIYALNEIIANRKKPNLVKNDPISSNLFATIYIQDAPTSIYKTITIGNRNITEKRVYFGPITLEKLRIKLIDNRGNIVNLHGNNWSFTLAAEILYQY